MKKTMEYKKTMGLYLHFPFCVRKCRYCDFLSFAADEETHRSYIIRLMDELRWRSPFYNDYEITTIFIGGGTPSLMSGDMLLELIKAVHKYYRVSESAEISIECNPGTLDKRKLATYYQNGINRLSFGLQSMDDNELRILGRIHSAEDFVKNYKLARRMGFENINIDLMSGLPGQSMKSWERTLKKVIKLDPEHISAYSLIIEEVTEFWDIYGENAGKIVPIHRLPDEDTERSMYYLAEELLADAEFGRYEISNYSKYGKECRHNLAYWRRGEYLGCGLGAASMIDNCRFVNTTDMKTYINRRNPFVEPKLYLDDNNHINKKSAINGDENIIRLSINDQMEETMFLGLRCMDGVSISQFERDYGVSLKSVYGDVIKKYEIMGLLRNDEENDRIYLTRLGIDVSNVVLADFLL